MTYQISADMLGDIARSRNDGATWAWLGRQYGIPPAALHRAYLRKSRELYPAAVMPAAADHAPLSVLNRTGQGIRTMIVCSCGWKPKTPPARGSTRCNAHMAHRRSLGLPRFDYAQVVFGEGPWQGQTWDQWYAEHGGNSTDPYTGQKTQW